MTLEIEKTLQHFSSVEQVSVNQLINRALKRWVEWDYYSERFGYTSLPTAVLPKMMKYISEEEAAELGRWTAQNVTKEFVVFWFKEFSVKTLLNGVALLSSKYANRWDYEYVYDTEKHVHILVLTHGMGRKWSIYYENLLRTAFEMLSQKIEPEVMENQLVVRIPAST